MPKRSDLKKIMLIKRVPRFPADARLAASFPGAHRLLLNKYWVDELYDAIIDILANLENLDQALDFYGRIFAFTLRGRSEHAAFIDIGDQFINLIREAPRPAGAATERRHVGLVARPGQRVFIYSPDRHLCCPKVRS